LYIACITFVWQRNQQPNQPNTRQRKRQPTFATTANTALGTVCIGTEICTANRLLCIVLITRMADTAFYEARPLARILPHDEF